MPSPEILKFDDLTPHLLLKNGNYLYKVPFRGGFAVLKVYYGSRGVWGRWTKSLSNVVLYGQTSYMPKTRCRVERECIELWRSHGFRVFDLYEDVVVDAPTCVPGGYMLFEYVKAPRLIDYLQDDTVSDDEKFKKYQLFLTQWSHRHDIAIADKEPRLIHENGDGKHVMILDDGDLLWFDFEMVYRSRSRVPELVSHELVQFIWFLLKTLPKDFGDRLLEATIEGYGNRARLESAHMFFFNHPNPLHRFGRALDRKLRKRAKKATSKYNVALTIKERLDRSDAPQFG